MRTAFALAILLATPLAAQEKTFDLAGITNIDVRDGITLTVTPGPDLTITATAVSGNVDYLQVRKFGGWLALNRDTRWFIFPNGRRDDIHVTVTLPELRNLKAYDTASATATGFTARRLRAEAREGGTVTLSDIAIADLMLSATDAGTLTVTGTCGTADIEAVGAATVTAQSLTCENVAATTGRAGQITATATNRASRDDTKGGTIMLSGNPDIVTDLPNSAPAQQQPEG